MADGARTDRRETTVRLAVRLVDPVTGGRPRGRPRVRIDGSDEKPIRNPSGYYVFRTPSRAASDSEYYVDRDRPAGTVTLTVDGDRWYLPERRTVALDDVDPALPVVEVGLRPSTAYPFPPGTTLVRGVVRDEDENGGAGVPGATVRIEGRQPTTETNADGEFVLAVAFDPDDSAVVRADDEHRLTVAGETPIVEVTHPEHGVERRERPISYRDSVYLEVNYN
jgi:hypothetical protein